MTKELELFSLFDLTVTLLFLFVCLLAELFYTERTHLRMLRVLDNVFYQKLNRESILPPGDIKHIFTNLEEIVQLHGTEFHLYWGTDIA